MEIRIKDKWIIRSDPLCYQLRRLKIAKEGKNIGEEYEAAAGYFKDLKSLLKEMGEREVRESDARNLFEIYLAYRSVVRDICEVLQIPDKTCERLLKAFPVVG